MKRFSLLLISITMFVSFTKAQNEFDALRYSTLDYYGEARFNAMGGSFGALGANMSALSINPGGLGVYNSSDFSFSTSFHNNYTESNYKGNRITDGKLNFHIGNIGLVGSFKGNGGWEAVNLAIGYNRTNNYNTSISIKSSTDSSLLINYVNELNSNGGIMEENIIDAYPFSSNLAYQTCLVNPLINDSLHYNHVFANSKNLSQLTNYETRGGAGEMYFALGGNYSDKLYVGALIGIPTVNYVYDRNYSETSETTDTLTDFKNFTAHDYVKTTGAGVNFKIGMIYKISDWFRFGTAFHTPSIYSLADDYETTLSSEKKDGTTYSETTPYGSFNYVVTTPYRLVTSASFIIGRYGAINADYEIVDYSTARIKEDNTYGSVGADFSVENQNIRTNFQSTHNIRVGTEWRVDPFRIRAGYRLQGNSINENMNIDNSASIYSGGVGIKGEGYYFDISYSLKTYDSQTIILEEQNQFAATQLKDHYLTFTLGFRF